MQFDARDKSIRVNKYVFKNRHKLRIEFKLNRAMMNQSSKVLIKSLKEDLVTARKDGDLSKNLAIAGEVE